MLIFMGQQTFFSFYTDQQHTLEGKSLCKTFKCPETKIANQNRHASDKIRSAVEILSKILGGPGMNLIFQN